MKVGLAFGALGLLLTLVGILRGNVPLRPANILVALLLGGGVWFLVSWAVATAAVDVENDLAEDLAEDLEGALAPGKAGRGETEREAAGEEEEVE